MHTLALRATAPYLIGDRKYAIGDLVEFQTTEEQKWFISTLNWSAFQPAFREVADADLIDDADVAVTAEEMEEMQAKYDAAVAKAADLATKLAEITAATPAGPITLTPADPLVQLADAVRRFTPEQLVELPGLGKATAPRLIEWAATIPPSEAIDVTPHAAG